MVVIKFILLISLVAPCILAEGSRNCSAPNGLGLRNLIYQVDQILPKEQIREIIKSYDDDSEVKALRDYIRRPETLEKLRAIRDSDEYQRLKDYACRVLHIDLQQFHKWVRNQFNPSMTRAGIEEGRGIRGLINDIDAVLPHEEIRSLYRNLMATDEELVKAVENLKSEEFRQLLLDVRNNVPAYKELTAELRDLGVPLDEMRELVAKYLGWSSSEENLLV